MSFFFPYPWVIGPERSGSWSHQKLLVGDPILPGAVAKGNMGCLKALGLPALESFLPSLWVGPYWTKEEVETIMSYISPSSFTLLQYQWCFSKNLCRSHGLYAPLWSLHNLWVMHFLLYPNQRNGSLLSIFWTNKVFQIPWHGARHGADINTGSVSSGGGWAGAMAPKRHAEMSFPIWDIPWFYANLHAGSYLPQEKRKSVLHWLVSFNFSSLKKRIWQQEWLSSCRVQIP